MIDNAIELIIVGVTTILTGIISVMLGIGGGIILVPLFNILIGLPIKMAIGTTKFLILFNSASSAIAQYRYGRIDWKIGVLLQMTIVPGAILGANLVQILDPETLKTILAIALIITSLNMMRNKGKGKDETIKNGIWPRKITTKDGLLYEYSFTPERIILGIATGFTSGLIAGITGLGGGIVNVPLMNIILKMPIHISTATSSLIIMICAIPTVIVHTTLGHIDYIKGLIAIPGLIIGGQVGGKIVGKIKAQTLKTIFAIAVLIVAIKMIYDTLM